MTILIQQLSVLALLPLVNGMADDRVARAEGHFPHGWCWYMVVAFCHQYSVEGVVVAYYHCWSQGAYR
jgi:hypothetical protein